MKDRTNEEGIDPATDKPTDNARRRGELESRGGEKHGNPQVLGIPTVLDRVIQQAIAQVLGPLFEVDFSENSYGYRPGRSAHMAVAEMEKGWKESRRHLLALGADSDKVHMATRSRKGYWRTCPAIASGDGG